jgi:two-component system, cell cycle response regulator DivK
MGKRATVAKPSSKESGPSRRGLVLLADDSVLTCELFSEYLTHQRFEVIFAHDGEAAVTLALQARPDVVVMDLSMPRLNGVAAIERLKSHPRTRRIPIIVLTGRVLRANEEEALQAGADVFLTKPCLPDEIERVIVEQMEKRRAS